MAQQLAFSLEEIDSFPNDGDNQDCHFIKTLIIKLIQSSNPPVIFNNQEFLESIEVFYIEKIKNYVMILDLAEVLESDTDISYFTEFIVSMKTWQYEGVCLFQNIHHDKQTNPFVFFFIHIQKKTLIIYKVNECDPSFLNQA